MELIYFIGKIILQTSIAVAIIVPVVTLLRAFAGRRNDDEDKQ